ncbi:LysR substrate-binding domain-containing protein [Pararhodobacter sp. CCB-MM2]|uniref:LysR substrate-binding domain-containing protein n=1 Tax=Pararhodobacter sp. CCB-MM2 TaxID=1786003 RepID=UPI0009F45170|nr:LysR substrate-binding domain-containing protein [Pararhodobacter sp. CCB-MM2]
MTTLRQLRFLVAVADTLNFTRAAEICHVTQPTLSAGLKELEDHLGIIVAERSKRRVMLTQVGEELVRRARTVLTDVADMEAVARTQAGVGQADLRLGVIPTVGPFLIPRAMPMLRQVWPELRLFLREELTERLLEGLADGRLDLIIIALPYDTSSIETELLFEDGYQLATPIGHSLAGNPEVTGSLLAGAPLLLLEKGHCLQRHALEAYAEMRSPPGDAFAATSLPTLLSMVEEGLGITLLPQLAIDAGIVRGQSVSLTPLPTACPRKVVLGWRSTSPHAETFRRIADVFRTVRALMS